MLVRNCKKCGKEFEIWPYQAKDDRAKFCSAGCRSKSAATTHGMSRTRIYTIWSDMKSRCADPNSLVFSYYGGRGIAVCRDWVESFEVFRDWALANGYSDSVELDRKDTDDGYSPDNCRWATRRQQMRNTRKRKNARTSIFKGVSWCSNVSKWRVQVVGGGRTHVGLFADEIEAARAYDAEASRRFGEFASVNFKKEGAAS